ncbi:MAG: GtrA family protein [Sphingobium sp.]|nr:GtrA family protein [Sphingobium sp.]
MLEHGARLIRFCLVGGLVTLVNYGLLMGLTALGLHYVIANTLAWILCVSVNFVINRRFTFGRTEQAKTREFTAFVATYMLQYVLATVVLVLLVEVGHLSLTPAFVLTLVTTTLFSYTSLARFVFPTADRPVPAATLRD